jgi:hypothetical protein
LVVSPLRALPVVGRQIRSFDALAAAAATTADDGSVAVSEASALLESGLDDPGARVAAAVGLAETLTVLEQQLEAVDLGPSGDLVGPLQRARDRFATERERALFTIDRTVAASTGVAEFLEGPSDYLLLAANNAEMQAGSGMFLQVGVLHVEDGRIKVGELVPSSELFVDQPVVPLDPDVEARWGVLLPNQEWRNLNVSPRFDASATVAAGMWEANGNPPVDGVLAVDVAAVGALLEVTGPIVVDGKTLTADNIAEDLTLDQYVDYEDDRDERRDRLGRVVRETFTALDERQWSPSGLLRSLQGAGEGRHVLAWSPDAVQQEAWEAIGLDGRIGARSLLLAVLNRGGNKLDPYLDVSVDLAVEPDVAPRRAGTQTSVHRVTVEVTLTNQATEDLPRYVAGPHPESGVDEGAYRGIVSLTIPGAGGDQEVLGGVLATLGDDGPARVLASSVVVDRGDSVVVTFRFDLPEAQRDLLIEPSARLPATSWHFEGDEWDDEVPVTVGW